MKRWAWILGILLFLWVAGVGLYQGYRIRSWDPPKFEEDVVYITWDSADEIKLIGHNTHLTEWLNAGGPRYYHQPGDSQWALGWFSSGESRKNYFFRMQFRLRENPDTDCYLRLWNKENGKRDWVDVPLHKIEGNRFLSEPVIFYLGEPKLRIPGVYALQFESTQVFVFNIFQSDRD